jgi:hypothetical protein
MNKTTSPTIDLTGEWEGKTESQTVKDQVYEVATISAVAIAMNSE